MVAGRFSFQRGAARPRRQDRQQRRHALGAGARRQGAVSYGPDGALDGVVEVPTSNPTSVTSAAATSATLHDVMGRRWARGRGALAGAISSAAPDVRGRATKKLADEPQKGDHLVIEAWSFRSGGRRDQPPPVVAGGRPDSAEDGFCPPGLKIVGSTRAGSTRRIRRATADRPLQDVLRLRPPATALACSTSTDIRAERRRHVIQRRPSGHAVSLTALPRPPQPSGVAGAGGDELGHADAVAIEKVAPIYGLGTAASTRSSP